MWEVNVNLSPRHEDVLGSGDIALPFFTSALEEVSGQFYASAALPLKKYPPVPLR
jgi:hypothetical protein